ncbi:DUF983 domain-containing protein [Acidisphaera sp. L21]|uniref:DUF983 domain-containing protein n=1 Tax=Acidisphaera sp. L21 TaxID=1641851 RepID=UPI00131DB6F8|nr:DUF983 domain-containing protein [Acidisphaera sp. L21]
MAGPDPLGLLRTALLCRCPRCGQASIFTSVLTVRERCPVCELNLAAADTGDGAAAFLILIEGAVLVVLAFYVEFHFNPPLWVHVILWPVLAIPFTILLMRPFKAFLVAQQFRNRPGEMGAE